MEDLSKIVFSSTVNYMKRSNDFTGTATLALPAAFSTVNTTVAHNLGYVPYFDVFADLDNDGIIWAGEKISEFTDSSAFGGNPPTPLLSYWSTLTTLTVHLDNSTSPTATGSRQVWYIIYLDYGATA